MVVFGRATAETAVSQQDALPIHGIVVVVIMTNKYTFHIALFFHGCKQTGVQGGRTSFLSPNSINGRIFIGYCLVIFGQRNMEERQGKQRSSAIGLGESLAAATVPVNLVELDVIISIDAFDR